VECGGAPGHRGISADGAEEGFPYSGASVSCCRAGEPAAGTARECNDRLGQQRQVMVVKGAAGLGAAARDLQSCREEARELRGWLAELK
jgi:hypothetical protein